MADWQENGQQVYRHLNITPESTDPILIMSGDNDEEGALRASLAQQFVVSANVGEELTTDELLETNRLVAAVIPGNRVLAANPDESWNTELATVRQDLDVPYQYDDADTGYGSPIFETHQNDHLYARTSFAEDGVDLYESNRVVSTVFFRITGELNPKCKVVPTLDGDLTSTVRFTTDGWIEDAE